MKLAIVGKGISFQSELETIEQFNQIVEIATRHKKMEQGIREAEKILGIRPKRKYKKRRKTMLTRAGKMLFPKQAEIFLGNKKRHTAMTKIRVSDVIRQMGKTTDGGYYYKGISKACKKLGMKIVREANGKRGNNYHVVYLR